VWTSRLYSHSTIENSPHVIKEPRSGKSKNEIIPFKLSMLCRTAKARLFG
jgi:hypothetical protein